MPILSTITQLLIGYAYFLHLAFYRFELCLREIIAHQLFQPVQNSVYVWTGYVWNLWRLLPDL